MEKRDYEKLYKSLIDYVKILRDDCFEYETINSNSAARSMRIACDRILRYSNDLLNIKVEIKNIKSSALPFDEEDLYIPPPF